MDTINHIQFSIKCSRKLPFFSSDYELSEWVKKTALPIVDDVFSALNTNNTQVSIENLVVDVGQLTEQNFRGTLSLF